MSQTEGRVIQKSIPPSWFHGGRGRKPKLFWWLSVKLEWFNKSSKWHS